MEVSKLFNRKNTQISILIVLFASLYSCGTYQSAYNYDDDGIYTSNTRIYSNPETINQEVVVVDESNFD